MTTMTRATNGFTTRLFAAFALTATAMIATAPGPTADAAGPVVDDFDTGGYSGGSGWSGDWVETGDGGSATGGSIQVVDGTLSFDDIDGDDAIERSVDLSGFTDGTTLRFTIVDNDGDEDLRFRFDTGNGFETIVVVPESPAGTTLSYEIPAELLAAGTLRIDSNTDGWGRDDTMSIDDIEIADHVPNPDLAPSCGIDVEVILDESGSIDSRNAVGDVEDGVRAFAQGLAGTTSSLRFVEFSTTGRDVVLGGSTDFREVDAALLADIDAYLDGTGPTGDVTTYSPGDETPDDLNFTNWEAGLDRARPNEADVVVFITDGVPNTVGTAAATNGNGGGSDASAAAALDEAATIRATGTKLLGVGVGQVTQGSNLSRLENLIEPSGTETWEGSGTLDISTVDVISVEEFDDLDDALRQIVFALCSPSVSITKVDQDGNGVADLDVSGTVQVTESGRAADDYEWVSPNAGAAADAGTLQTVTTSGSGSALFQWIPNTVADPEPWTSSFTFAERLTDEFADWTLPDDQPDCTVERLLTAPAQDGSITDTFPVELDAIGPDETGLVTFELTRNGNPFEIEKSDLVSCTVVNNAPAEITIVKNAVNDGTAGDTFAFTGDLGSFDLDDSGDDSQTFTVLPGTYTVAESDPTALSYELSGIACDNVTGTAGGIADLENRSVDIDVEPGSAITCAFTNIEVPTADLDVTKNPAPAEFAEHDGSVTYTVTLANPNGADNPIEITSITDSATLNGDTTTIVDLGGTFPQVYPGGSVVSSSCPALIGTTVADTDLDCEFTVAFTGRNADDRIDDTVTVAGTDTLGNALQRTASADVDVTPVPPTILVDKQNLAGESTAAPGGTVSYTIDVTNPGTVEDLTLTGITDVVTVGGSVIATPDLTATDAPLVSNTCTDLVGTTLAPGDAYHCEFSLTVSGLAQGDDLVNTATVTGRDDDPTPQVASDTDPAERTVLGEPPAITVSKTGHDDAIAEPGADITYDIDITNQSTTEAVTITQIVDEVSFTPDGGAGQSAGTLTITDGSVAWTPAGTGGADFVSTTCDADDADGGIGTVLAANGGTTSCSITVHLPGNAGDSYDDTVTVDGLDETGDPVEADDNADTPVVDVPPSVQIVKTADPTLIEAGDPTTYRFEITNLSAAEPLFVVDLVDDVFGSLNGLDPDCDFSVETPVVLAPNGQTGDSITCEIQLTPDFATDGVDGVHTNVATVSAADDEILDSLDGDEPLEFVIDSDDATVRADERSADLSVVKTAGVQIIALDDGAERFDWILDIANQGPNPAVEVVVSDVIPPSLTVEAVSSDDFDCTVRGQVVTCTRPAMAVGATGTVTISVSLPDGSDDAITNVGTVESNTPDPDLSDNSDEATVDVIAQQPPSTNVPPTPLPPTGSGSVGQILPIGLLLLAAGSVGALGARRRRSPSG